MTGQPVERRVRRRSVWIVVGIVAAILAVGTMAVVAAHHATEPNPVHGAPILPALPTTSVSTSWNVPAEEALASQQLPVFPPADAQPQPLTTATAGPPIHLPPARMTVDGWIRSGFPGTTAGALAQLTALDQSGLVGGDPATYSLAYQALSLPGAPAPAATGLWSALTSLRAVGGLPDTGPAPGLSAGYQVAEGLIKGTADDGRYVVACVLGELTAADGAQVASAGIGDCQALRWTGVDWRISPGRLAAPAPCVWPGSAESVSVGYRELI